MLALLAAIAFASNPDEKSFEAYIDRQMKQY